MFLTPLQPNSTLNSNIGTISKATHSLSKEISLHHDTISFKSKTDTTLSPEEIKEFKKELQSHLEKYTKELNIIKPSWSLCEAKSRRYDDEMGNYIFNFNHIRLYSDILTNKHLRKLNYLNQGKKELIVAYDGMPEIVDGRGDIRLNYFKKAYKDVELVPLSKEDRKNMLITTLYHELIHAKQLQLIVMTEGLGLDKAFGDGLLNFITKNIILRPYKKQQNSIAKDSLEGKKAHILLKAKRDKSKSVDIGSIAYINDPFEVDAMFLTLKRFKNNADLCKREEETFNKAYSHLESEYNRIFTAL